MGSRAFLGRSGVCTFLPLARDDDHDNTPSILMQAAKEFAVSYYTPQSDVYQVGVVLLKCRHLSAAGLSFAQKLKSKPINAVDDPYLQRPTPMW